LKTRAKLNLNVSMLICESALLLAHEFGTKVSIRHNNPEPTVALLEMLSNVNEMVEPLISDTQHLDLTRIPPYTVFLVYKVARITTERLPMELDERRGMANLTTLRKFLQMVRERWSSCGKSARQEHRNKFR
jgi:hypothetical protein